MSSRALNSLFREIAKKEYSICAKKYGAEGKNVQLSDVKIPCTLKHILNETAAELGTSESEFTKRVVVAALDLFLRKLSEKKSITELPKRKNRRGKTVFVNPDGTEFGPYCDRPDRKVNAAAFYRTHWKLYADAGLLFQNILNDYDQKLIPAIRSYCQYYGDVSAREILPPPKRRKYDFELEGIKMSAKELRRLASAAARREAMRCEKK